MKQIKQLTCIIEREDDSYCPQIDIASQGNSVEEARNNLIEAIEVRSMFHRSIVSSRICLRRTSKLSP